MTRIKNKRKSDPPRTVNKKVHEAWMQLKTFGDVKNIQQLLKEAGLPNSQPTVTLALNKGFVFKPAVETIITNYFNEKLTNLTEDQKSLIENVNSK